MGYEKTKYPGIFKYVGTKGTVFGIDYYSGGKKHREMVGSLLGDAKTKLAERRNQAKRGITVQRRTTFRTLAQKYVKLKSENKSFGRSPVYLVGSWDDDGVWTDKPMTEYFGNYKLFQITPEAIEEYKKMRKDTPVRQKLDRKKKKKTYIETQRSNVAVNRELEILRHILNKALEWGWIDENPFKRFKRSIFLEHRFSQGFNRHFNITRVRVAVIRNGRPILHC